MLKIAARPAALHIFALADRDNTFAAGKNSSNNLNAGKIHADYKFKRNTKMKKYTIGFLVFAMVAISTVFAIAQKGGGDGWKGGRGGHHRGGFGRIAEKLNLTDAQKEQVKNIMEASRAKVQPLKESMKANRQKMDAATANGQFDEAAVAAIAQEQATIGAQLIVEKERAKSQMFQILTADQKAQFQQFEAQMKNRFENRKNRREKKVEQNENDGVQ